MHIAHLLTRNIVQKHIQHFLSEAVSALGSVHQRQWICTEKQLVPQTCLHTAQLSEGFLQISSGLNTHLLLWCLTHTVPVQFHLKEECVLGDCSTM